MPKILIQLEKDEYLDPADAEVLIELKALLDAHDTLPTDLLKYKSLFRKYLSFY
jgi:hypothetical protein